MEQEMLLSRTKFTWITNNTLENWFIQTPPAQFLSGESALVEAKRDSFTLSDMIGFSVYLLNRGKTPSFHGSLQSWEQEKVTGS